MDIQWVELAYPFLLTSVGGYLGVRIARRVYDEKLYELEQRMLEEENFGDHIEDEYEEGEA